ncbi:MAG: PilZ domain-containing protein [Candidatus Aminicenantes bacterium]|nr:PilZ domain-containing protein [Candidatus Aminicenantes bacterium]
MSHQQKKEASKKTKVEKGAKTPVVVNRRREWRFELPLAAEIEGQLPLGQKFKKKTVIENISSTGAYFSLDSNPVVGSKVSLAINLPTKLTEGKKVKLVLEGTIIRIEKKQEKSRKLGVAVRFKRDFHFVEEK